MDIHDFLRKNWPIIAHCDLIFNCWIFSWWSWANNLIFWPHFWFILGIIYGYSAFNKKSFLNRRFKALLDKIDEKTIAWARGKLKYNPSNRIATWILPFSMIHGKKKPVSKEDTKKI